jgi:hypothetical protein
MCPFRLREPLHRKTETAIDGPAGEIDTSSDLDDFDACAEES